MRKMLMCVAALLALGQTLRGQVWVFPGTSPTNGAITVSWDPNADSTVGYHITVLEPGLPTREIQLGNVSSHRLTGLRNGSFISIFARAYNAQGLLGNPSNTLTVQIGSAPVIERQDPTSGITQEVRLPDALVELARTPGVALRGTPIQLVPGTNEPEGLALSFDGVGPTQYSGCVWFMRPINGVWRSATPGAYDPVFNGPSNVRNDGCFEVPAPPHNPGYNQSGRGFPRMQAFDLDLLPNGTLAPRGQQELILGRGPGGANTVTVLRNCNVADPTRCPRTNNGPSTGMRLALTRNDAQGPNDILNGHLFPVVNQDIYTGGNPDWSLMDDDGSSFPAIARLASARLALVIGFGRGTKIWVSVTQPNSPNPTLRGWLKYGTGNFAVPEPVAGYTANVGSTFPFARPSSATTDDVGISFGNSSLAKVRLWRPSGTGFVNVTGTGIVNGELSPPVDSFLTTYQQYGGMTLVSCGAYPSNNDAPHCWWSFPTLGPEGTINSRIRPMTRNFAFGFTTIAGTGSFNPGSGATIVVSR